MRRRLFAAVSLTALCAAPAWAQQTITDTRDEPVETANADGQGNPDNIVIGTGGRVILVGGTGPAVRVNSDNTLTTGVGSLIQISDTNADGDPVNVDGATGIQIDPGSDTTFIHNGAIVLDDSADAVDSGTDDLRDLDEDGNATDRDFEADGPLAADQNKTGVLIGAVDANFDPVPGQAAVTGDVQFGASSAVTVQGQNSYGVRAVADIDGDLIANGQIIVTGEDSRGLSIEGDVSGDVQVRAATVTAPGGSAVVVDGDVGGGVRTIGAVSASGYRTNQRFSESLMALFENEAEAQARGDVADNRNAGSAFIIAGSVQDGVFFSSGASVTAFTGGGAAVTIRPGDGGAGDQQIGAVLLPDDFTADLTDDDDASDLLDYAFVNEGAITADGVFDGKDATAFLVVGRSDNGSIRSVILSGDGISNVNRINAQSYDGIARGVHISGFVQADTLHNAGVVSATATVGYQNDGFAEDRFQTGEAIAIQLDDGSNLRRILNDQGTILARVVGAGESATAIFVADDRLEEIRNTGAITAQTGSLSSTFEGTVDRIAVDARQHAGGLNIIQERGLDGNGDPVSAAPIMRGDILFGSGDDRLELLDGEFIGDVNFGTGSDVLVIDGATFTGAINSAKTYGDDTNAPTFDNDLLVDVTNGRIVLTSSDALVLRDAVFRNGGVLDVTIDNTQTGAAFLSASGDVTFESGSNLAVSLGNVIGLGGEFEVVTADGALSIADENAVLTTSDAPYLYRAAFSRSQTDPNTLLLTLELKTTEEMGMNVNQAAAFDEAIAAFEAMDTIGAAFAGLRTEAAFFAAYDQLLPEYAASAIQFALASNDAAAGALETRLRNARMSPDDLAGVWIQEFGYFADRSETAFGPGYRGQGVGVAVGLDRPVGPFYAVGVQLSGAASEIEEVGGFDEPMIAISGQFGGYAAMDVGGFDINGSIGIGYDYYESERNILIDDFSAVLTADWSGWHVAASAQAGRDFVMGRWTLRPEASLSYLSLFESGFAEQVEQAPAVGTVDDLALVVDDRDSSVLLGAAGVSLSRRYGTDVSWWAPSLRVAYRGEFSGGDADTTARFGPNGDPFTLRAEELSNSGVLVGFGLSAGSNYSTFSFAYDADIRDDFIRHVARLVIRLTF